MQVHKTRLSGTRIKLSIEADQLLLEDVKRDVLQRLKRDIKLPGFRAGKVPLELVEKNVDQAALQSEFIDTALNRMYSTALGEQNIRPVAPPEVSIKKFVPFTTLEFEAEVETIGEVKLPDYKKISVDRKTVTIADKDIDEVVGSLMLRMAEKVDEHVPQKKPMRFGLTLPVAMPTQARRFRAEKGRTTRLFSVAIPLFLASKTIC